jgi:hypothetical protein
MRLVISFLLVVFSFISSQDTTFVSQITPIYQILKINQAITIDGVLDDPAWQKVEGVTGFSETNPNDNTRPPVRTVAYLAYDDNFLYVAFICFDDPEEIRATWSDRDQIWDDDYMGLLIDTYGKANLAYFIAANPLGIQGDTRISASAGEDVNFDMIFSSRGRITERGYELEFAIPFASLRFPDREKQEWRVNFWRTRPHESRATYSWARIDRDNHCWMCQWGYLRGLRGVESGSSIDLIPSLVAGQSRSLDLANPESGLQDDPAQDLLLGDNADFGFTAKWAINPSLTVEGTFNPDFSQVESDAAQIDINNTFALFFPERRPFFMEGSDLFSTGVNVVYTRSINDPIGAAKVIGRWQNSTLAYLTAVDENTPVILPFEERSEFVAMKRSLSNIARYKYDFGNETYLGALLTDRRWMSWDSYDPALEESFETSGDGFGSTLAIDGKYLFGDNFQIEGQIVASYTREPDDTTLTQGFNDTTFANGRYSAAYDGENYSGNAINLSFARNARHWSFDFDFRQTSPTFRAANGFVTQNDNRRYIFWTGYTFYYEDSFIERFIPNVHSGYVQNFSGLTKDAWINAELSLRFKGQTVFEASYMWNNENFKRLKFDQINRFQFYFNSDFSDVFRFGSFLRAGYFVANRRGNPATGDPPVRARGTESFEFWSDIKPWERLVITPTYQFSEAYSAQTSSFIYRAHVLRTRFELQITRELALRLVGQYVRNEVPDDELSGNCYEEFFSIEPLLYYKLNPFSAIYAGMTSGYYNASDFDGPQTETFEEVLRMSNTSQQIFIKFQYLFNI